MPSDITVAVGPNGLEDYRKLAVDEYGRLISSTSVVGLFSNAKITIVSLDSTSWTALPPTALANRNSLAIQNQSSGVVIINYSNTAPAEGIWLQDGETRMMTVSDGITIYGRMQSGSGSVAIEELA